MTNNISIVIPCYNSESFIKETIHSVLSQTYNSIEVIVIDDGSTDNSKAEINSINDLRLSYHYQNNKGVSEARNNGLKIAKGNYILFLDSDDIISPDFLQDRLNFLEKNDKFNGCTSTIEVIDEFGVKQNKKFVNLSNQQDLIEFNPNSLSCPSGYLFRLEAIKKNQLKFEPTLSSSADKFFLYNYFTFSKMGFIENSPLYYRVYKNSMSNNLTEKLVNDQVNYLQLLSNLEFDSPKTKKKVLSRINYTIGASFYNLKLKKKGRHYLFNSALLSFSTFYKLLIQKLKK